MFGRLTVTLRRRTKPSSPAQLVMRCPNHDTRCGADVVAARHADFARHLLLRVPARRAVLRARLRDCDRCRPDGACDSAAHARALVGVAAARVPADHVRDVERTFDDGLRRRRLHVLPESRAGAAAFLGVDRGGDVDEFLLGVLCVSRGWYLSPPLARARGDPRGAAVGPADQLALLVVVERFAGLHDEALGIAARFSTASISLHLGREAVAVADRLVPLPVDAAVDPLDAAQLGRHHRAVDREQEAAGREPALPARRRAVVGVAEQRILVADAPAEVAHRVGRRLGVPVVVLPAQLDADQAARFLQRVVGKPGRLLGIVRFRRS